MAELEEVRRRLARPASLGMTGNIRSPDSPLTSWLGRVTAIGRDEAWPRRGRSPMAGICQVNVGELAYVPPALEGLAVVSLFMAVHRDGTPDPERWEVRSYFSVDELRPANDVLAPTVRPCPVRWELIDADLPAWDDACLLLDADEQDEFEDWPDVVGGPVGGFKVGGWPSLIQGELENTAHTEFVFQVDSDERTCLSWGDAGVVYVGRRTVDEPDRWDVEWQCC